MLHMGKADVKKRILLLLDIVDKPVKISGVKDYLGEPVYSVNISLGELAREGLIEIEQIGSENWLLRTHQEAHSAAGHELMHA